MLVSETMKSDYPCPHGTERLNANLRIRSIILDLCARYGATGILGIGQGSLPLCFDLHSAGYTVAITNPITNLDELEPAYQFHSPIIESDHNKTKKVNFNMAIITDPGKLSLNFSTLIQLATSRLESGSVILLSIPYYGYLKSLLTIANKWWHLFYSGARFSDSIQYWSRKALTELIKENGFVVIEHVGVRDASLQWETLIIVARKS